MSDQTSLPLNEELLPAAGMADMDDAVIQARFTRLYQRDILMRCRDLQKYYGHAKNRRHILNGIDIEIHRRELVCVIGPSGCGKSTLGRLVAGLEPASSGQITVAGQTVKGPDPDRGMVFQAYTLFPWLTVLKNVMFGLKMKGETAVTAESKARQWLDLVGLAHVEQSYPHQLSGGMKQRVAIARTLVNEPKLLVMDEPFAALDPHTRQKMQQHLLDIWSKTDLTILFVTHDLDEAIYLADRILVLKANPGEVQSFMEVPLPRPRLRTHASLPAFAAIRQQLEQLVHGDAPEEDTTEDPVPMTTRLVPASDQVEP